MKTQQNHIYWRNEILEMIKKMQSAGNKVKNNKELKEIVEIKLQQLSDDLLGELEYQKESRLKAQEEYDLENPSRLDDLHEEQRVLMHEFRLEQHDANSRKKK